MSDEDFARDVLKIAVAQACHQMDFTNIETSAMEVLIDLMQMCTQLIETLFLVSSSNTSIFVLTCFFSAKHQNKRQTLPK